MDTALQKRGNTSLRGKQLAKMMIYIEDNLLRLRKL